ncbi:acetylornithine deacetylase/succinyl-diaminopimelate desuccinylase family protein [Gemmatimonas aurantiaca]|uniref:acetylornithine deacetylase/succinyl-diaminopimelate desuccinylase family protein n=1 Tax=Gemmatimonas aurantiaca TaxID=173480 RepID=UPI00301E1A77
MVNLPHAIDRVFAAIDAAQDEMVSFTSDMIRIPTVNPPGDAYVECAEFIGRRLAACDFTVDYPIAEGRPEHTPTHPRMNVVGLRRGRTDRPLVHLNGHFDVVPAGAGWTVDPFGGEVRDGRIYGRGSCDMKAGITAAIYAAEAIRRAGIPLHGSVEISGTVDEESGGFAGMAYLAQQGRVSASRTDAVIITEPTNTDRLYIGHRGVYWFEVTTHGRIAHGSMPFLGTNAIEHMGVILDRIRRVLMPVLQSRTTAVPVKPDGARHATLNINGIAGGQPVDGIQTPCVADICRAIFDRRFLAEEGFEATRAEIVDLLETAAKETPELLFELRDLMVVHPVKTPDGASVVTSLERSVQQVLGRPIMLAASPGTYDHKHVDRIAGVPNCVAYGPGILDLAHQPDEYCAIDDLMQSTKVLALSILELTDTVVV